ncbi:Reverse transcriptase zinc-binding domain-containing protein [Dioscorea alata]|uniref:Reverse transcriptase zinc-binding domain-containing protein n=1 Tax=Dioscorea alata TaxID=55571 RepID=A0ACB7W493_DIOAL|nr:Reverse transcriptase zinc-binding domain-containing protein [Dioscorea alata]
MRCNRLPSTTCVLCHSDIESSDHLFLNCPVTRRIWDHFTCLFKIPKSHGRLCDLWASWRMRVLPNTRDFCDLLVKALLWNVWLARNDIIFNASVAPVSL